MYNSEFESEQSILDSSKNKNNRHERIKDIIRC